MKEKSSLESLIETYRSLVARLADVGFILQGTITERIIHKDGKPVGKGKTTYGPYYQWTFKEKGKTRTVNLSKEQVPLFQEAIENNRKITNLLKEMRQLSRQLLEASTQGVNKRKFR